MNLRSRRLRAALRYGVAMLGRKFGVLILCSSAALAEPVTIVALGDSLTHGYGLPPEDAFPVQLERWLAERGAEAVVVNAGVSGDTSAGGLARFDWSVGEEADALILELGANDMLRAVDPAETRRNLSAIMDKASARGLPTLIAGISAPMNYGAAYKAEFDSIFADLAAAHGAILDRNFLEGLTRADAQTDGLHPTADGVARIVVRIGPKALELVERARK